MAIKTPKEAFDAYIQMRKAREKMAEQYSVSSGGVQERQMINVEQLDQGVFKLSVGAIIYTLSGEKAASKRVFEDYRKKVETEAKAVSEAENKLRVAKNAHEAKPRAALADIEKKLAFVEAQLNGYEYIDVSDDKDVKKLREELSREYKKIEPEVKRCEAEFNKWQAAKKAGKISGYTVGKSWSKADLDTLYKRLEFDPKTGTFNNTSAAFKWGANVVKGKNGYYFVFPEGEDIKEFVGKNMKADGSRLLKNARNSVDDNAISKVKVDDLKLTPDEINSRFLGARKAYQDSRRPIAELEKNLKDATDRATFKTMKGLQETHVQLSSGKRILQEQLDDLARKPSEAVKKADAELKKAQARMKGLVDNPPKGVVIDAKATKPKAVRVPTGPKALGWGKYLANSSSRLALKGLGVAAMAVGIIDVIDSFNPQDLEQGSGTRNAADVQGDQGAQNSGTVSSADEKYFKDKKYVEKFMKVMAHYGIQPLEDEKGISDYRSGLVLEELTRIRARMDAEGPYVDAAELELRKSMVAAYDKNPKLYDNTMQLCENIDKAQKVLSYYCEHGGPDEFGENQPAEYWKGLKKIYDGGQITDEGSTHLISYLSPRFEEVNKAIENEKTVAEKVAEPTVKTEIKKRPETNTKPTIAVPAKPERKKRVEASRIPGEPEPQPAPQIPQNKEAAPKQANATNTLRGAGYDISDQTTEMGQTRTSGGRGGMA